MAANGAKRTTAKKKPAAKKPQKRTQQKKTTPKDPSELKKAAADAAQEYLGTSQEDAETMTKAFNAAQASRTMEIPLTVNLEDDDGKLVTGKQNFTVRRWTMSMSMVLQPSLQKVFGRFMALLPEIARSQGLGAGIKDGKAEVQVAQLLQSEEAINQGMMDVWPDVLRVCVGTLYQSNAERFTTEEECRVYLEEHCVPTEMLELSILIASMNTVPEQDSGKKGALASLFHTVASQQP